MSNGVLLAILSCPRDSELVARHWPWFLKAQADEIVGLGTKDGQCEWPEPIRTLNTGEIGVKKLSIGGTAIFSLLDMERDALEAFLNSSHHSLAIVESDNLIVKPFPRHPEKLLLTPIVPNLSPHFSTSVYYSTPRFYCRETAAHVLHHAKQLMALGATEHWCSDRFYAACAFRAKIRPLNFGWTSMPITSPGDHNANDAFIRDARAAIAIGTHSIHGVKTPEQLRLITL